MINSMSTVTLRGIFHCTKLTIRHISCFVSKIIALRPLAYSPIVPYPLFSLSIFLSTLLFPRFIVKVNKIFPVNPSIPPHQSAKSSTVCSASCSLPFDSLSSLAHQCLGSSQSLITLTFVECTNFA
jgi:hypothetical protein